MPDVLCPMAGPRRRLSLESGNTSRMTDNTGPTDQRHPQPWTSSGNGRGNRKQGPFSTSTYHQPPCSPNKTAPPSDLSLSSSLLSALPRGSSLCPIFSLSPRESHDPQGRDLYSSGQGRRVSTPQGWTLTRRPASWGSLTTHWEPEQQT